MKLFITFSILVLSFAVQAATFQVAPGLWEVKYLVKTEGKTIDPHAEMKKVMAKMTPEQKKQMEAMMAKMGNGGVSPDGMKVCLTQEMLEKDTALMQKENKDCTMNFTEKSATKINATFNCKDGAKGTAVWNIKSGGKAYDGHMNITQAKGKTAEINFDGQWAASDCGKVKPVK